MMVVITRHAFSFTIVSNIAITYAVDSYQGFAGEALVSIFVIRNIIAMLCSFYSSQWVNERGLEVVSGARYALCR